MFKISILIIEIILMKLWTSRNKKKNQENCNQKIMIGNKNKQNF